MKKIGIIGGLGPEATIDYYRILIESSHKKMNGGTPEVIIYSLDLNKFINMMETEERDKAINFLSEAVNSLHRAGADFVLIASNTPHIVFNEVENKSPIPMLSIVEETLKVTEKLELKKVGLLGTKFTMQADFYQKVFSRKGIEVVVPTEDEQEYIHNKLMEELVFGKIVEDTKKNFLSIAKRMIVDDSIEGLILGCTEIPLILTEDEYYGIPFLNNTKIHSESALRYCFSEE